MKKILSFLSTLIIIVVPILVMVLYGIFIENTNTSEELGCSISENICELDGNAPENEVIIEFLEDNYESVLNQKDGNIPMATYKERLNYVISYRPEISKYLETESYRYQLPKSAERKVVQVVDEGSYSHTVNSIHNWILDNIDYTYNRKWYTAQSAWEEKSANCNGISFLTCGMMREVGIPCMVVANDEHAWTEYLYVDDAGRLVWNIWDQGLEGYPALSENVYEYDLS